MIWIAIFVSVSLGAFGQIFMKVAMGRTGGISLPEMSGIKSIETATSVLKDLYSFYSSAILSIPMFFAVVCYGISYVLWLGILSKHDLSFARPFVSFGYIIVILYGYYAGEQMGFERVLGIVLICFGLFFVARGGMG